MEASELPEAVKDLIARHIHSVEQLEILLLLARQAGRAWTASAVSYELRISGVSAAQRLEDLRGRGLVVAEPGSDLAYRFRPATPELEAAVQGLAEAYLTRRVSVITAIFARPRETDPVRSFADAFRLTKKKGDGHG